MKLISKAVLAGMLGMLVVTSALAEAITVKQVITLKRLGYTDEQVAREAAKSVSDTEAAPGSSKRDAKMELNEDAIRQLRAAGAGEMLIQSLCEIAKKTTTPDVLEMAKAQQSLEQMVERIIASCPNPCPRPGITVDEARLLVTRQIPAAVIVALAGRPLGAQQLIMLGEARTPPQVFDKLADALGFDRGTPAPESTTAMTWAGVPSAITAKRADVQGFDRGKAAPESTTAMTEAGVPAAIIVALAGLPLEPQQLITLAEVKTPLQTFNKLGDTLGFDPVRTTAASTEAMTQAGVPQDIIARLDKAALDKELREYEKAHQVWTKEVAPYSQMYDRLVADTRDSDQLTFNLPDRRYLTATYSGSPQTYYVGGSKGDGAESFVGPLWRLEIPKPGFHLFADPEIDVSLAIRRDDSGNVTLYRVDGPGRVAKVPLAGDVRSFAAILGIDLRADAVPPGS